MIMKNVNALLILLLLFVVSCRSGFPNVERCHTSIEEVEIGLFKGNCLCGKQGEESEFKPLDYCNDHITTHIMDYIEVEKYIVDEFQKCEEK